MDELEKNMNPPEAGTEETNEPEGMGPESHGGGLGETDAGSETGDGETPGDNGQSQSGGVPAPAGGDDTGEPEPKTAPGSREGDPQEDPESPKAKAIEKIIGWKKANRNPYSRLICEHLVKRCGEDNGLARDVLQEGKNFVGLFAFVTRNARRMASNNCACVEDSVVYEWAEDYIRSAEPEAETEPKKLKKPAPRLKPKKKPAETGTKPQKPAEKPKPKPEPEPKPEKPKKEKPKKEKQDNMDGQMDLFSLFG